MRSTDERLVAFGRFCNSLSIENGKPFKLEAFQKVIVRDFFDGVRETVIILPKKNGKTTLMAALALFHLLTTHNAECIMVASSRDQAEIILRQARMFVRQSPDLQRHLQILQRTITFGADEGRIRVLASDVDTADGAIPTLVIVDELHRHKNLDLYGVMRDGLGPRQGQMITISTAGATMDSPLGHILQRAHATRGFIREGTYNHVRSGTLAFHEWCLDPAADVTDMKVVKTANPASWHTLKALRIRYQSGSMTPYQWLRFACGIWTIGEEPWMDSPTWDGLAQDIGNVEPGEPVWLAVRDGAIAIVAQRGEGVAVRAIIGEDDWMAVEKLLIELAETYDVQEIAYDAQAIGILADQLKARGLPMVETPHRPERLTIVSATLQRLVAQGLLHHDGDPDLRSHVLAGTTKQSERGWRLMMTPENRGLIALAFAAHSASLGSRHKPNIHVWAGIG